MMQLSVLRTLIGVRTIANPTLLRTSAFIIPSQIIKRSFNTSYKALQNAKQPASTTETTQTRTRKVLPKLTPEEYRQLRDEYYQKRDQTKRKSSTYYSVSLGLVFLALAFASVPLYRAICQKTGWAGTPMTDQSRITPDKLVPIETDKKIRVSFTAETSRLLPWKFIPQQREVYLVPGETALAFYKAKNTSDKDITGMATYSVTPDHVAPYFNKIQCFCFEEQRLNAGEEVDMPLFFFIDPDFAQDPSMRNIDDIVLHYTFFKATHDKDHQSIMDEEAEKKRIGEGN